MGLQNRRQQRSDRRRHARLLAVADKAINHQLLYGKGCHPAPATFVALAFAMFAIRPDEDEARDYLNAGLAERGHPLLPDEGAGQ